MSLSREQIVDMILVACREAKKQDEADAGRFGTSSDILRLPIIPHQIRSLSMSVKSPSFADFLEAFDGYPGPKFE